MTKKDKIKFINEVWDKFENARNHGGNNNWWYPTRFVIAYDVKYSAGFRTDDLRKKMTKRQNDFYSDDNLYNAINLMQGDNARQAIMDIEEMEGVEEAYFAGRMGGWLEVKFSKDGFSDVEEDCNTDDVNYMYKLAKELEKNETEVEKYIVDGLASLKKYLDSKEAITDFIENYLMDDEEIADRYKGEIKNLTDKLK